MNKEFFIANRKSVIDHIEDGSLLVMFSGTAPHKSADYMYCYTPHKNFYYLTGIDKPNVILVVSKVKDKLQETLFIEKSDPTLEKWEGRKMNTEEAALLSGISDVQYVDAFYDSLNTILSRNDFRAVYLNLEHFKWNMAVDAAHSFAKEISEKHPYLTIKNIYSFIGELRTIKSDEEVDCIKKAIDITGEGIKNMMRNVRPCMFEYQAQAYFDFSLTTAGVKEHAFPSIIASGINGATLHYEDNNCEIEDNSLVLADVGAQYNHYHADITRTFPVNGRFTERQKTLYNIVLKAQQETINAIKPGVPFKNLNEITKSVLIEECKKIGLIKEDKEISKYYYHGVSHYLGLDTHDTGDRDTTLQQGMVLTVEPGLYVEDEKIGIRIEDDILVTESGNINLSSHIIKSVEEIEEYMSSNR